MKTIAVINRKGGVGKTTTTVNVAAILAEKYKARVLVVDLDPSTNASMYLGVYDDPEIYSYHVLCHKASIEAATYHTKDFCGIDLVPSGFDLDLAANELNNEMDFQFILKKRLEAVKDKYDYCLIDCPPARDKLTTNAMVASQYVILPCEASKYGLNSIDKMDAFVNDLMSSLNSNLKNTGFVFTRKKNTRLQKDYANGLREMGHYKFYKQEVREAAAVNKALEHDLPLILFCPNEPVTQDYLAVTEELLAQMEG